jgi:hypothetical protein
MKRILLYSPDVIGHPRVYCRVVADALSKEDCEVVVAIGFTDQVGLADSPDLHPLASRPRTVLLETRTVSKTGNAHLSTEELVVLQRSHNIDTTLFIEADKSNSEFHRIASGEAPRLYGRNLGIFANTAEWYPGEDSFTGQRRRLIEPSLKTTLGNVRRAVIGRKRSARHFYENVILKPGVLDEILVKDERLANWRGPPVFWMPEISRPSVPAEAEHNPADMLRTRSEIEKFLAANRDREPVLYFGDAAYYKGYDLFLQFIAATSSTCAIHAGRSYDSQQLSFFRYDVRELRVQLRREGRLYETNSYVSSNCLKQFLFESIRLYITTHRLALSSSTVIQALEYGKPVLVPNRGLLGYRIRENRLGEVYAYEDLSDLEQKAKKMWASDLNRYSAAATGFWQQFSDESIGRFFVQRLLRPRSHV